MRHLTIRGRIVAIGAAVIAVVLVATSAHVYYSVQRALEDDLRAVMADRIELVTDVATAHAPEELPAALSRLGIRATVRTPDGESVDTTGIARVGSNLPAADPGSFPTFSETLALEDGTEIEVRISRAGVDQTLRRLRSLQTASAAAAIAVAALLLAIGSRAALSPTRKMAELARKIADGASDHRLDIAHPHTELGKTAHAFNDMLDTLEAAIQRATDSDERTRRFLADAAHQLRTPIAGAHASAEGLLYAADTDEQQRLLRNVLRETDRAGHTVSGLLTLARLDRGHAPARRRTSLDALVAAEVERAADHAPDLAVNYTPPSGTVTAEVDAAAITDALGNILDNARRYAATRIDVRLQPDGDSASIEVCDDGPGIPAHRIAEAFERFSTLDAKSGSGLGLAIARATARSHGGDLTYEDHTFVLSLPLRTASISPQQERGAGPNPSPPQRGEDG